MDLNNRKRWIWDIEVYPNLFLICAKNVDNKFRVKYQVSPLSDDRKELAEWLQYGVIEMVGFNNLYYDYPVLHEAIVKYWNLPPQQFCLSIFNLSKSLVKGNKLYINDKNHVRKQIDLFKINHYDNKAKMTSLKLLEFNLRLINIRELPFEPEKLLTNEEINTVINYCDNDVDATELLYNETISDIELREKLSPKYGIDFTNYNSTKIGEWILLSKIIEQLGESAVYNIVETEYGQKKFIRNTNRDSININDVIFPYIKFQTEPFQKILEWFKSKIITETKGVFSKIPFEELKVLEPHYCVQSVTGKQKTLNIIYKGFQYDFGVGGIHGCIEPGVYESDDNYSIIDIDVASFYPNLAIKNKFYPEHFGEEFCDIYESIYLERKKYPKKTAENLALKLALNGSYGKSNSKYSALCDPLYTMKTTINGQLLLCMLSEMLMEGIPDIITLQVNTDGTTVKLHNNYIDDMRRICKEWEKLTNLVLEEVTYSKMIIKDVNNYIAVGTNGYVKRKGAAFIYKIGPGELELHKNFSMLIVPKALEAYFVNNIKPEEFIRNHNDMYDFFKRTKINKSDNLFSRIYDENGNISNQKEIQRITRYYISGYQEYHKDSKTYSYHGSGTTLIKIMPPLKDKTQNREFNIEAGYLCEICNNLSNITNEEIKNKINYQYYIDEVYKVINLIENKL